MPLTRTSKHRHKRCSRPSQSPSSPKRPRRRFPLVSARSRAVLKSMASGSHEATHPSAAAGLRSSVTRCHVVTTTRSSNFPSQHCSPRAATVPGHPAASIAPFPLNESTMDRAPPRRPRVGHLAMRDDTPPAATTWAATPLCQRTTRPLQYPCLHPLHVSLASKQYRDWSDMYTARHAPNGQSGMTSRQSSRRTSDESDYMAISQDVRSYETAYIRPASGLSPIDPRTDLDLLQSHRMSHVAETGQLTPRVRKPGNSGEWASVADNQISTINGVNYFVPQKTPSPPAVTDPREEAAGAVSPPTAMHDGYATSQARSAVPLTESYAHNAPYYPDTYEPRGPQHQYSYDEVPYEVNTDQNQRESQVLRSVNSGFQVLKPGTFQAPSPEEMELAERRQSKKLQKKRRTSGDSRQSAFVEQV